MRVLGAHTISALYISTTSFKEKNIFTCKDTNLTRFAVDNDNNHI